MEINRLSGYSDFLGIVEYPAVVFCEDGEVLSINNAAVKIVGSDVESIAMEPDKFMVSDEFWPTLDDKKAYMVLFELRSDVTIGSVSLERIINHIGVIALYLYKPERLSPGPWFLLYLTKHL